MKRKRRQEWESHRKALAIKKQNKPKQPQKEEREVIYSQIAQDMEKTRNVVRRSIRRASTISAEE